VNRITDLYNIKYPIIQGGMIWVSGWRLASAVSNAGGLGLIGAGSMYPDILREHIRKAKQATDKPFGVNVPLLYADLEEIMKIIIDEDVKIVFTSAGNPKKWTSFLQDKDVIVTHVVSSVKFAKKAQDAGVNAIVAEGFEAGGHNGREETTTFTLIPATRKEIKIPLIAAGGIATGRQMLAAMQIGAEAVQMGSRFVACKESSAHENFKKAVLEVSDGDTALTLKEFAPVRLIKNKFYEKLQALYQTCPSDEELLELLGRARAKLGMFEGDLDEGELEIGQIASIIDEVKTAENIIKDIMNEYISAKNEIKSDSKYNF